MLLLSSRSVIRGTPPMLTSLLLSRPVTVSKKKRGFSDATAATAAAVVVGRESMAGRWNG
jgi:hypothetical protein